MIVATRSLPPLEALLDTAAHLLEHLLLEIQAVLRLRRCVLDAIRLHGHGRCLLQEPLDLTILVIVELHVVVSIVARRLGQAMTTPLLPGWVWLLLGQRLRRA